MRYELTDHEWTAIKPMLPNKPRGVPRVNDRRVLNGIFWVLRSGAPWRDVPDDFAPYTTCYNRFVRWRRAGVWAMYGRCPRCKRNLTYRRSVRVQPCIRPIFAWRITSVANAATVAAGPDVIR